MKYYFYSAAKPVMTESEMKYLVGAAHLAIPGLGQVLAFYLEAVITAERVQSHLASIGHPVLALGKSWTLSKL